MIESKTDLFNENEKKLKNAEKAKNTENSQEPLVRIEGVYKIFKQGHLEVVALKNINLTVMPGELIVVMGPSGSGKTTLLNVISGMEKPNAGRVMIKNLDVTRLKDEGIQKLLQHEIGIIFQFFNLIPSLTAAGNIELPMNIIKLPKDERKKRVKELLEQVGLENRARHRPFTLSGGEKQRVAIAQAFANNPSLILADEPTGNIDSVSAEKIMNIFHETMLKNPEKAIIIVTHDPVFRKIADRTLVLRDGEIIRELGKISQDEQEHFSGDIANGELVYAAIDDRHLKAKQVIEGPKKFPKLSELIMCPSCHSRNILKEYDKKKGSLQIMDQNIIGTAAIACLDCHQISFQPITLFNIKKDLNLL
ncbi:MAG: ABC transporter ATP-binding protein [Promethearchaeota archaeon]